jgi:hypothetical protein
MPNIQLLLNIAPSSFLEAIVESNERRANELDSQSDASTQAASA